MMRYPLKRGTAEPVVLEYCDAQNDRSVRQVMPLAVITDDARSSSASTYLQARCSIAKATRSFRLDRIESIADDRTGEVSNAADWVAQLTLGAGQAFSWADERTVPDSAAMPDARSLAAAPAGVVKLALVMLVIGYLIGRLRLIELGLKVLDVRHGLWL